MNDTGISETYSGYILWNLDYFMKMGCDQSKGNKPSLSPARVDRIINIEPQQIVIDSSGKVLSRKEASSKSYQGVQGRKLDMDPAQLQNYLEEYRECEDKIRTLEKDDPLTLYYIKKSHLQSLDEAIQATKERIDNLKKAMQNGETASANKGQSLRKIVAEYGKKGVTSNAEQEFLTSASRLEIATTELEMLNQDRALVESDVFDFKDTCIKLAEYYERQDKISEKLLMSVTNSKEALLYKELAEAEARKIRVSETFQRWKEGRLQAIDGCRQFSFALKKWAEITIPDDTPSNLYDKAEEVRDDLVTALQSINNTRFYIKSELPYCSKTEMSVLEKALSYIFIDMNFSERRLHAESCYTAFHNRAVALFAWIDMTLKTIIVPDVRKASEELTETSGKLRDARFHTITQQFPDVIWKRNEEFLMEDPETGMNALSDLDSVRILAQLDATQLTKPPTRSEIYGKFVGGTDYKSMLKNSMSNGTTKSNLDKNVDDIVKQRRRNSLKKDIIQEDTVGLA